MIDDSPRMSGTDRSWLRRAGPFALVWLYAFTCHAVMILLFSNWTPLADQWDSEGFLLIRPWLEGQLTLADLLSPHNEHRIFTKRLFDLAVLTLNGNHWDNRVFALANAALYALMIALCFTFVTRATQAATRRILQAALLLMPLLLVGFENTLWGFQSPFYFSCLFTVAALRHVAASPSLPYFGLPLLVAGAGAILSLASGLLLPLALAVLLALDRRPGCSTARRAGVIALLLALAVAGYLALPRLSADNTVMARSISEAAVAALRMLSWPIPLAPLTWLPLLLWLAVAVRRRHMPGPADLFFLGLAGWVVLQALATGYGRGHAMPVIPWRYTDALLLGLLANLYFACRVAAELQSRPQRIGAAVFGGLVWAVTGGYLASAMLQAGYSTVYTLRTWQGRELVLAALLRHEPVAEDNSMLPYPHLSKMPLFLGSNTLRQVLGVDGTRLPGGCELDKRAYLSRAACAADALRPVLPLPQFAPNRLPPEAEPPSRCNLDLLNGRAPGGGIARGSPLRIEGWVGPADASLLPMRGLAVVYLVSDSHTYAAGTGVIRPRLDVASSAQDARYRWSGFSVYAATAQVEPGSYEVYLRAGDAPPCRANLVLQFH